MKPNLRRLIANFAKRDFDTTSKGKAGELFARKWFERNKTEYFQFPQSPDTMPRSLAKVGGKRPDFAISIKPGDSVVYVDAKFHKTNDVTEFSLTDEELNKFVVFREWIKTDCGDDGDRDIILMVYPQELDGDKFMWIHLDELLNGIAADINEIPAKKVTFTDRTDLWVDQDG